MKLTAQNHTLTEALLLNKRDPCLPASNYHELKLDLGTFCALLWVLFGEKCDYFENCFALLRMLDSDNVFANSNTFTPLMCRQITWAVINDSRQYFFRTVTADHFSSGRVRWPTSLLMQVIGADIQACRGISMGNFPEKWMDTATVGSYLHPPSEKRAVGRVTSQFVVPAGLPPPSLPHWSPPQAGTSSWVPDNASSGHGDRQVSIRQTDIHPALKQLMARKIYVTGKERPVLRLYLRQMPRKNVWEVTTRTRTSNGDNGRFRKGTVYKVGVCGGATASNGTAHDSGSIWGRDAQ